MLCLCTGDGLGAAAEEGQGALDRMDEWAEQEQLRGVCCLCESIDSIVFYEDSS